MITVLQQRILKRNWQLKKPGGLLWVHRAPTLMYQKNQQLPEKKYCSWGISLLLEHNGLYILFYHGKTHLWIIFNEFILRDGFFLLSDFFWEILPLAALEHKFTWDIFTFKDCGFISYLLFPRNPTAYILMLKIKKLNTIYCDAYIYSLKNWFCCYIAMIFLKEQLSL